MGNLISPAELPDTAITEFQNLMLKHYGLKLNFEEAKRQAKRFMTMFLIVSQPIPAISNSSSHIKNI